ncbi:ABC transporter substrate-binding protein [Christiangramia salexigens]|uniref:ABC transporter substrate-binding protein n=1 Tax=Christiangramia salexigens TaxID=1913577 RepID=A0A1L3J8D1_9FLAO|nr:ABC transporter substrate-binding protein [Christiangramia salexigens]APG61371.1 ABC transporter substrate-binding protein [Christiangramia salexigens]
MKQAILILFILLLSSCKDSGKNNSQYTFSGHKVDIENAEGFSIEKFDGYSLLKVNTPWPGAEEPYKYLLANAHAKIPENLNYDQRIEIPLKTIVVTSTTHIPALEALDEETSLIGFPGLHYISSEKTRELIKAGKISELGKNENLNTEVLLDLSPDAVIGFAINASNKSFESIQKTGIPVIFNGDWTEKTPLGKAEWIKFFGALFDKQEEANKIFNDIKAEYLKAKQIAGTSKSRPSVLSGSMFNDKWYMPYGNSWQARFIQDANANYLYSDTSGEGSLALSFESVLGKAEDAEFWISAGQFTSYDQLIKESEHYQRFRSVQNKNVYSVSLSKGETGGILFYELGPQRPDLILKDLISIFHPELLKQYEPVFYKQLQ